MNRRAPIIVGAAALVLAVAVFFLLVFPKMRAVGDKEDELDQAQQQEQVLRADLARLQDVQERAPKIRRQLARFRKRVPPAPDLPGLINILQNSADTAGVDFFSISPGIPTASAVGAASEIPTQITVIGGFFQVDEFLFRLETLPRAAKVISINISEGPDQLPQIEVAMAAEFYTTDTTAGPGAGIEGAEAPTPEASPTPSPSPTEGA